jgi:hypothetical protein
LIFLQRRRASCPEQSSTSSTRCTAASRLQVGRARAHTHTHTHTTVRSTHSSTAAYTRTHNRCPYSCSSAHVYHHSHHLARAEREHRQPPEFQVTVSFLELYNGAFYDLLDADTANGSTVDNTQRQPSKIHIRDERLEDGTMQICVTNVHEATVTSVQQLMEQLRRGSMRRVTKSTDMNATSSRSHAVFTLHISHKRASPSVDSSSNSADAGPADGSAPDLMLITTAKFNFVDLAVRV